MDRTRDKSKRSASLSATATTRARETVGVPLLPATTEGGVDTEGRGLSFSRDLGSFAARQLEAVWIGRGTSRSAALPLRAQRNPSSAPALIDSGLDGSGRVAARAEEAQGTPAQNHTSPSVLVYEDRPRLSERSTYKTVRTRCWSWLSGESPKTLFSASFPALQCTHIEKCPC